jgi:putative FmdB family regulatory protein
MPAYDFRCKTCKHTFEVVRPAGETTPPECPECGGETKRVFTPVGVHFKGSGFYNTDYKGKNAAGGSEPKKETPSCPSAGNSDGCAGCPAAAGSE